MAKDRGSTQRGAGAAPRADGAQSTAPAAQDAARRAPSAGEVGARASALAEDVERIEADVEALARETTEFLRDQLTRRPYVTLGAAASIGYVLGGGLPRWAVRAALGVAAKAALDVLAREAAQGLLAAGGKDADGS